MTVQLTTTVLISFTAVYNQRIGDFILRYPAVRSSTSPLLHFCVPLTNFHQLAVVNAIAGLGLWCGSLHYKSSYPTNLRLLAAGTCCQSYLFAMLCAAASRKGLGPETLHAAGLAAAAVASCAINAAGSAEPCPLRAIGAALLGILTLSLAPWTADIAGTLPAAAAAAAAATSLVVSTWVRWRRPFF